jgi:hypothetical protein
LGSHDIYVKPEHGRLGPQMRKKLIRPFIGFFILRTRGKNNVKETKDMTDKGNNVMQWPLKMQSCAVV